MGTCVNDEEDWFSDAREEVSSVSDCNSEVADDFVQATDDLDLWTMNPESVTNRRHKFFQSMGFSFKKRDVDLLLEDSSSDPIPVSLNSVSETDYEEDDEKKKLLRDESISSVSTDSISSVSSLSTSSSLAETFSFRGSFPDQILLTRDFSSNSSSSIGGSGLSESGSSRSGSYGDFQNSESTPKKGAKGWLKKLNMFIDKKEESIDGGKKITRVQSFKKQFKELSSLCIGQEFVAHDGSIVVMKFSHDGKYLASAGEDCVVRVWTITEVERTDKSFEMDYNNCVYFGMNEKSEIENEIMEESRGLLRRKKKKKTESSCAVLPSKVFGISETPQHEFRGHLGEILDLSWSEKGFLLSSSVDETVRLWRVGSSSDDECVRVFSHNSFVTCVTFNKVDENYFISGSIDGKVRIWDISHFRVVDYTVIRDIVTAVCYTPDAKAAVVGSMSGHCRFYHTIDNQLQLDREISLHGKKKKKKGPSKRITGFQFFPGGDSDKVMVTSADSEIRIICGVDTICKLKKGLSLGTTTVSPTCASFTSDGKHIVSSTVEDSGIHVWDYSSQLNTKASSTTVRSYEGFLSHNVSVAIPWLGGGQQGQEDDSFCSFIADLDKKFAHFPMDCFSPIKGATTTWPEEELGAAVTATASSRSKLRLLRSVCQNVKASSAHLWGLVIVTATWDGRIRVFHNYGLPIRV